MIGGIENFLEIGKFNLSFADLRYLGSAGHRIPDIVENTSPSTIQLMRLFSKWRTETSDGCTGRQNINMTADCEDERREIVRILCKLNISS